MSIDNLRSMFSQADRIDRAEGMLAYFRYNQLMQNISTKYEIPIDRVVAAFCALSPNNDYDGNLRSLVSVLSGVKNSVPPQKIVVSTYKHCAARAWSYVTGQSNFLETAKGLKIRSFYFNVLHPLDNRFVTVDGHICATWRGKNLTMKEAIIKSTLEYREIRDGIKQLAFNHLMLPHQYQATLWFTRKRTLRVKYNPQMDLLLPPDDVWRTMRYVEDIKPFPVKP